MLCHTVHNTGTRQGGGEGRRNFSRGLWFDWICLLHPSKTVSASQKTSEIRPYPFSHKDHERDTIILLKSKNHQIHTCNLIFNHQKLANIINVVNCMVIFSVYYSLTIKYFFEGIQLLCQLLQSPQTLKKCFLPESA